MRLGIKDQKVLAAFVAGKAADGQKLWTDGQRIDGHWLGGARLADWQNGEIVLHDKGSKAAESVQRQLRHHAAPVMFADYRPGPHKPPPTREEWDRRYLRDAAPRASSRATWRLRDDGRWYHPSFGLVARRSDGWYGFSRGVKVGPFKGAKEARYHLGHAITSRGGRSSRDAARTHRGNADLIRWYLKHAREADRQLFGGNVSERRTKARKTTAKNVQILRRVSRSKALDFVRRLGYRG